MSGPTLAVILFLIALFLAVVGVTVAVVVNRGGVLSGRRHREDPPPKP